MAQDRRAFVLSTLGLIAGAAGEACAFGRRRRCRCIATSANGLLQRDGPPDPPFPVTNATGVYADVRYETYDNINAIPDHTGDFFCNVHLWARHQGYESGRHTGRFSFGVYEMICIKAAGGDDTNLTHKQLDDINSGDHDYAAHTYGKNNPPYGSGYWDHRIDNVNYGVCLLKSAAIYVPPGGVDGIIGDVDWSTQMLSFRWAVSQGYIAGYWNREISLPHIGVTCIKFS
jgi:hypothetical protein